MANPYPLCSNCRHALQTIESIPENLKAYNPDLPLCSNDISLVTGEISTSQCSLLRQAGRVCGLEGRLFERRLAPDPLVQAVYQDIDSRAR